MISFWHIIASAAAVAWLSLLFLPWRPWSTKEIMNAASPGAEEDLSDITVLIPARNEAEMMQTTLPAIKAQGRRLQIILVDDQSTDGTAQVD